MIDTVKLSFWMTDALLQRLEEIKVFPTQGVNFRGNSNICLRHPYGYPSKDKLKIVISSRERSLRVETSLPKLLQGHNVFGSNRLEYLCLEAVGVIYRQLGVEFSAEERWLVRERKIRIGRLDLTCSFDVGSQSNVVSILEECSEQFRASGRPWSNYGKADIETVYLRQSSKRVTDKLYNKGRELEVHPIPATVRERDRIIATANGLVRFETTFRSKELKRLGRNLADNWTRERVVEAIKERLSRLGLSGALRQELEMPCIDGLNESSAMCYGLWRQGCNLRPYRRSRTLARARGDLRNRGIDIFRRAGRIQKIALDEVLSANRACFTAPKWLVRLGTIFGSRHFQGPDGLGFGR